MQLCSAAQLLVVALPRLSPLSSTFLALTVTVSVLVDRRGRGGCRCGHICEPSYVRVCCR